jgi:hypothetical protein
MNTEPPRRRLGEEKIYRDAELALRGKSGPVSRQRMGAAQSWQVEEMARVLPLAAEQDRMPNRLSLG